MNSVINTAGFFLLSHPAIYKLIPGMWDEMKTCNGISHFASSVVFVIAMFVIAILYNIFNKESKQTVWYHVSRSFYSALLFYVLSNPGMYEVVGKLVGLELYKDCPTILGMLLHSAVFFGLHLVLIR